MLESQHRLKSIKENIDAETIKKIETYRNLKLPGLRDLSEEEIYMKYIEDPFFRAKLGIEFKQLSKNQKVEK